MTKMLRIEACVDCKSADGFCTGGWDSYSTHACMNPKSPYRHISVDTWSTIPDWCPLEDAPEDAPEAVLA